MLKQSVVKEMIGVEDPKLLWGQRYW